MGKNFFAERFSLESAGSHSSSSLSEIITAFPITLSMFSSVYYSILFLIPHFHMSSSNLPFLYNGSSITLFSCLFWLILQSSLSPAIRPLFPPLLYCYFFPLLPSFLPSLWQPGLVRCRLREPRIHVVQGRRWGTWGLGPLAKTTSPAVA